MSKSSILYELNKQFSRRLQIDLVVEGVIVGLLAGLTITLYRITLDKAEEFVMWLHNYMHEMPLVIILWLVIAVCLGCVVCFLTRCEPHSKGSGIPHVDAEIKGELSMKWWRVLPFKFLEGSMCSLAGMSLGREGPSVQLGAVVGKAVSKLFRRRRIEKRLLITCGAAAGMAAAFHAPLTGTLFALEEIHKEFKPALLIAAMISSIASDFVVSQILGVQPVLAFHFIKNINHAYYAYILLLGVFCGLLGAAHNAGMFFIQETFYAKLEKFHAYLPLIFASCISSIAIYFAPALCCGGDKIFEYLSRAQNLALPAIIALLIGKYFFTTFCFASGAPGGTLFPLCAMGALTGCLFGAFAYTYLGLPQVYIINFVVLGVAGLFASVVRAPVTAVILAFELTGSFNALLAVSIVSIVSYICANMCKVDPFYEHLTMRLIQNISTEQTHAIQRMMHVDLHKELIAKKLPHKKELVFQALHVGVNSSVEHKCLAEIKFPQDMRIITINREGMTILPTGDTKLVAGDELLCSFITQTELTTKPKVQKLLDSHFIDGA